jgi:protease I
MAMSKQHLSGVRVAILAADGFEQIELTQPRRRLLDAGAEVEVVSLRPGNIRGMHLMKPGGTVRANRTIFTASVDAYDALFIPGGFMNPDLLRQSSRVRSFVKDFDHAGKPIATLCHGPWVLVSADLVEGRRLTSWPGIKDDVLNAGGIWENKSVVKDGNWITSRGPHDLLQFNRAIVEHFSPGLTAKERSYALPVGQMAMGGIALAAFGYGLRWLNDNVRADAPADVRATPPHDAVARGG